MSKRKQPSRSMKPIKQYEGSIESNSRSAISKQPRRPSEKKRRVWVQLPQLQKINIVMPIPQKAKVSSTCSLSIFKNQFAGKHRRVSTESC